MRTLDRTQTLSGGADPSQQRGADPLATPAGRQRASDWGTAGGDDRIRTGDQGFADPCLTTWPRRRELQQEDAGAEDGIRTRDLLLGKETRYHCATSASCRASDWCRGGDSNSYARNEHSALNAACLPVPPPRPMLTDPRAGRSGGTRTPGLRFWRPLLFQLSYTPSRAGAVYQCLLFAGNSPLRGSGERARTAVRQRTSECGTPPARAAPRPPPARLDLPSAFTAASAVTVVLKRSATAFSDSPSRTKVILNSGHVRATAVARASATSGFQWRGRRRLRIIAAGFSPAGRQQMKGQSMPLSSADKLEIQEPIAR